MSIGLLNTALSGLVAFQRSLETTSNNISNVNTEGYSRQHVELATRRETFTGAGFVGTGVNTTNIVRSYDQFITKQVRSSNSAFGEVNAYYSMASQIDNVIADENTGLAPAMKAFFDAVNGVANDPTSIPSRQIMLSEADSLAQNFNTMGERFSDMQQQVNSDLDAIVTELNGYAQSIADLNTKIVADVGLGGGRHMPNDLLDQRDALLNKIAEKVDVSVVEQKDGSISVFMGQGQSLVLGKYAATLSVENSPDDPLRKEISIDGQSVTGHITGGELYGKLRFRDEVLNPAQQQMGLLAAGLAIEFNNVHQNGIDLNGDPGTPLFSLGNPEIPVTGSNPASTLTATFVSPISASILKASDYRVTITGVGYTLTRLSDNTDIAVPEDEGFSLVFDGNEVAGDTFLVRPVSYASRNITTVITDPRKIAAAQDDGTGLTTIPGDNRNALAMANLETSKMLLGGTASYSQAYGQMVSQVGTLTHSAQVSRSAQDVLLKQATSSRESVSGVNLDEEAANLIKYQNAYQASAQVVSVANSLFDSLMGALR